MNDDTALMDSESIKQLKAVTAGISTPKTGIDGAISSPTTSSATQRKREAQ